MAPEINDSTLFWTKLNLASEKVRPKKGVRKSASKKELLFVRLLVRKITFFKSKITNHFQRFSALLIFAQYQDSI
jgi:hypothetical protein